MSDAGDHIRFAILCLGRTGSTHLWSLLDSHPEVRCHGEVFDDTDRAMPQAFANSGHSDELDYLRALLAEPGPGIRATGFKLPMNALRAHPRVEDAFGGELGLKVIRLSRRNHLAQLVSRRLMRETSVAHSIDGDYGDARIELEPQATIAALERIEAEEHELDRLAADGPVFGIAYEELADEARLAALQRWLGVRPASLSSWFRRLRREPLSETVSNWDELSAALAGTPHARHLTEEQPA